MFIAARAMTYIRVNQASIATVRAFDVAEFYVFKLLWVLIKRSLPGPQYCPSAR